MISNSVIQMANRKYIRRKKCRRYAYRIPYFILFIVAFSSYKVAGFVVLLIYAITSEFVIRALTKREKVIEKKIECGDYIIKDDVVKDIYLRDVDPQEPSKGFFKYMSFVREKAVYSREDVFRFEINEKVLLQIVVVNNKDEIINVFKIEGE